MFLAWMYGPQDQQARLRAQRWQQVNVAERHILDGFVRGAEDPDAARRPQDGEARRWGEAQAWRAQQEARQQWQERQHRQWVEAAQRQSRHGYGR